MDIAEQAADIVRKKYDAAKKFHEQKGLEKYFQNLRKQHKYFCIFGSGVLGKTLLNWLSANNIRVDYFCDNDVNKVGTTVAGVKVIDFVSLETIKEKVFVMVSATNKGKRCNCNDEINHQLRGFQYVLPNILKFIAYYVSDYIVPYEECLAETAHIAAALKDQYSRELFLELLSIKFVDDALPIMYNPLERFYDPQQYFTSAYYVHTTQDCIVDCGAFKGDTLHQYLDLYGKDFKAYDCFEMDRQAFRELSGYIESLPLEIRTKITAYQYGVHSEKKMAHYSILTDTLGSTLDEEGKEEIELIALDDIYKEKKVTMINMDIEGSELSALKGARELIQKERPLLAISIYHSTEQFFRVPAYILEHYSFYKLYLRQHTTITDDTVLYAVPE